MLKHASPNFSLRPKIHFGLAEIYREFGNMAKYTIEMEKAKAISEKIKKKKK